MRLAAPIALTFALASTGMPRGAGAAELPIPPNLGVQRAPVAVHGTSRAALAVTPPATFRTRLEPVPAASRLLTAIAVPTTPPGGAAAPVEFRVTFEADSGDVPLYTRVVDGAVAGDRRWIDVGVTLDPLAGRSGTLRFDAVPVGQHPTTAAGWWAPPELVACDDAAPSLLLITIDALRGDRLSAAGYARPTTPHLDAFAADATRFAAAFTGGPKTIPSVPQILTGRYFYWQRSARGLPELLGDGAMPSRAIVNNPYVATWLHGRRPGFAAVQAGELDARAITSAALRWLTSAGRCPTALFLHYLDPHTPYRAPARFARRFIDPTAATTIGLTFDDVTRAWQEQYGVADRQRIVDLYDGNIAYADHHIGRLLRGLAKRGRLDRTLVVITADHGEELWDHRKFFHGQSLYDELLHVPLLVRWPALGHGRVVADVVRTVDLVPTIAEALARPIPEGDGRSLAPLASGAPAPDPLASGAPRPDPPGHHQQPRVAFALVAHAEPRTPERQAVRTATRKLIRDVSDGALQFYDLVADPGEKRNLGPAAAGAADLEKVLAGFRGKLDGTGYQLRLRGLADRPVRYAVDLATDPPVPVIAIDRLTLEPGDRIDFRHRTSAFGLLGTLAPGDEDHVRFDVLATAGVLKLAIRIDGAPAPEGTIRVGAASMRAGEVIDLADAKLDGAPATTPHGSAPVAELWRASAPPTAAPSLDDATRERLRQLGYVE